MAEKKKNGGFTLTEVAIVLGIFSVIMTGIWSLANDARERARYQLFDQQIMQIVQSIRSYYMGRAGITGNFTDMQSVITNRSLGLFPSETIISEGGALVVRHPWNGLTQVSAGTGYNTTNTQLFSIRLQGLNPNICANLILRMTGQGALSGLDRIWFTCPLTPLSLPTTLSAAQTACKTSPNVNFVYRLRPPMN